MAGVSTVRFTQYFLYRRRKPDRAKIRLEWVQLAIDHPIRIELQSDGRIRKWVWIAEETKYLRVILLSDGETVHNAFFDRDFEE